ncbi:MAG: hypothetical protein AVDCRST_MAG83-2743, partial [uncultured Arthrobacter sp.]
GLSDAALLTDGGADACCDGAHGCRAEPGV